MEEVKVKIELVEAVLNYMGSKPTNETGEIFTALKQTALQQRQEFANNEAKEKMRAELKAEVKDDTTD